MKKYPQGGLSGAFIGIMIATIIGVGVTIPIVQDVIADSNITGLTAVVLGNLPILLGVVLLVAVANLVQ
jgi:Tfp pilus assembly major pilin PilA